MNPTKQAWSIRSIDWSINGQLPEAVVVVNRPPFRGALTPASRSRQRKKADAALIAACRKQSSHRLRGIGSISSAATHDHRNHAGNVTFRGNPK